jgi:hypothetical protein
MNVRHLRIHCSAAVEALRSRPMSGRATLTTVPSRKAMPEQREVGRNG